MEEIVNRVAKSPLITFNLEDYYDHGDRVVFDIKDQLFQGMVLREKDFRAFLRSHDWSAYKGQNVALTCSVEAIVPTWAFMLLSIELVPFAKNVFYGTKEELEKFLFQKALSRINPEEFRNEKIVIKGCSKYDVPVNAYVELVRLLQPVAASIMYGEPCSTVPLFKRPKNK